VKNEVLTLGNRGQHCRNNTGWQIVLYACYVDWETCSCLTVRRRNRKAGRRLTEFKFTSAGLEFLYDTKGRNSWIEWHQPDCFRKMQKNWVLGHYCVRRICHIRVLKSGIWPRRNKHHICLYVLFYFWKLIRRLSNTYAAKIFYISDAGICRISIPLSDRHRSICICIQSLSGRMCKNSNCYHDVQVIFWQRGQHTIVYKKAFVYDPAGTDAVSRFVIDFISYLQ
jgi:hypothetical protein